MILLISPYFLIAQWPADTRQDKKKVIYEKVKLEQDYRNFDFESPWEGTEYIKREKEKI